MIHDDIDPDPAVLKRVRKALSGRLKLKQENVASRKAAEANLSVCDFIFRFAVRFRNQKTASKAMGLPEATLAGFLGRRVAGWQGVRIAAITDYLEARGELEGWQGVSRRARDKSLVETHAEAAGLSMRDYLILMVRRYSTPKRVSDALGYADRGSLDTIMKKRGITWAALNSEAFPEPMTDEIDWFGDDDSTSARRETEAA